MGDGRFSAGGVVRIMVRCAPECAVALEKTGRLAKAIGGAGDLKLLIVARAFRVVELQNVGGQRLAENYGSNSNSSLAYRCYCPQFVGRNANRYRCNVFDCPA